LDTLWIVLNSILWEFPQNIGDLISLKALNLAESNLTGSIPESIGNLTNLRSLCFNHNNLTGNIPQSIGNLINIKEIKSHSNQLTGEIPESIGNLINLNLLYLHNNQLTGEIPSSIGNLINLQQLYLSNNQLTGFIPDSICNIIPLTLALDDNQLTGAVPLCIVDTNSIGLYIQNNQFIDLPNFDSIINIYNIPDNYINIKVYNNKFTFEDLEKNINISYPAIFSYIPQDSVLHSIDTTVALGDTLILSSLIGGTANQYQWFKDTTEISSATNDIIIIPNVSYADSGIYYCRITNTIVTDLTLWRRLIKVNVDTATGIKEEKEKKQIKLYPNPAKEQITIEFNSRIKKNTFFELYDVLGNKVMSRQLPSNNNKTNVSTKNLTDGIYSYKIVVNNKVISTDKLIIIKK
jgi:hypothetical protein